MTVSDVIAALRRVERLRRDDHPVVVVVRCHQCRKPVAHVVDVPDEGLVYVPVPVPKALHRYEVPWLDEDDNEWHDEVDLTQPVPVERLGGGDYPLSLWWVCTHHLADDVVGRVPPSRVIEVATLGRRLGRKQFISG